MSTEVKVPTLGESVTEATIGEWLKKPGEAVALDEPIASLETDKVAVEVPSPVAGVMGQQLAAVGDTVNVGATIATVVCLGLSLVTEHVHLHGGRVWVDDRTDGQAGARFVVELPIDPTGGELSQNGLEEGE